MIRVIEIHRPINKNFTGTLFNEKGEVAHYLNGELHCTNGPAKIYWDGSKDWYIHGKCHREGGPAVEYANGDEEWYQNDKLHRLDGPALVHVGGIDVWYINGKWIKSAPNPTHENEFELDFTGIQTDEGPHGGTFHVLNGKLHNEDGPAAIYADSSFGKGWFYKDVCYGYNNDFTIQTWKEKIKEIEKSFNG